MVTSEIDWPHLIFSVGAGLGVFLIGIGVLVFCSGVANLLRRLNTQTFVLNTRQPLLAAPAVTNFALQLIDEHTLECEIAKEQNLNGLFQQLTLQGVEIVSMRNKVNRLEEIFMRLVENRGEPGAPAGASDVAAHG